MVPWWKNIGKQIKGVKKQINKNRIKNKKRKCFDLGQDINLNKFDNIIFFLFSDI